MKKNSSFLKSLKTREARKKPAEPVGLPPVGLPPVEAAAVIHMYDARKRANEEDEKLGLRP